MGDVTMVEMPHAAVNAFCARALVFQELLSNHFRFRVEVAD
jgi:hypothetical protein